MLGVVVQIVHICPATPTLEYVVIMERPAGCSVPRQPLDASSCLGTAQQPLHARRGGAPERRVQPHTADADLVGKPLKAGSRAVLVRCISLQGKVHFGAIPLPAVREGGEISGPSPAELTKSKSNDAP